jgi:small subunit ribosomal protein S20
MKSRVKHVVKQMRHTAAEGPGEQIDTALKTAQSVIDKAAKKGALHPRTAARRVSRLAKLSQKSTA